MADDVVYTLGCEGMLFALDRETGREIWRSRLSDSGIVLLSSPVVHSGKVYVNDPEGLFVFRAGRQMSCLGRYELAGSSYCGTPVVMDDVIYLVDHSYLWALENIP